MNAGSGRLCAATISLLLACGGGKSDGSASPDDLDEESLVGGSAVDSRTDEQKLDAQYGARPKLAPLPKPEEICEGEGEDRLCKLSDPDPALAAAHGLRTFMAGFRWGMDVEAVLAVLQRRLEDQHRKQMSQSSSATQQDQLRRDHNERIAQLPSQHVKLEAATNHPWAHTFLNSEYRNDAGEDMVWSDGGTVKKFYFFTDGKLWKVTHAYQGNAFPGKNYDQVLEGELKKWFGYGAEEKLDRDERSSAVRLRWYEWNSSDGDRARAFDLIRGHGIILVSVVSGPAEDRIGMRMPSNAVDKALREETLDEVLEDAGICYDDDGNMIHDPERCKAEKAGERGDKAKAKRK